MNPLVDLRSVSRRFGSVAAVDSVDLTVGPGEVVGLLGANGAGKTTLIRLVLGLLRASGGRSLLFGAPPSFSARARVGYVPQSLGLYEDLSVSENWRFVAAAFHEGNTALPEEAAMWRTSLVGALPLGVQRRVAVAVALAHRPELLVLDEPTSGVGPLASARLWEQIRSQAERGAGVLVTTHNMQEAEQCDSLVIMVDGSVAARGTAAEIIGDRTVALVRTDEWQQAFWLLDRAGLTVQLQGTALRVNGTAGDVAAALSVADFPFEVATVAANLDEAFVAVASHAG